MRTYPSVEAFYAEAPPEERRFSPEVDFGVHWTDPPGPTQISGALPQWRVSWVANTGEVYAVQSWSGELRFYGAIEGRDNIEDRLTGWAESCGRPGSLMWIENRLLSLLLLV